MTALSEFEHQPADAAPVPVPEPAAALAAPAATALPAPLPPPIGRVAELPAEVVVDARPVDESTGEITHLLRPLLSN
jgi:hypothetical protein